MQPNPVYFDPRWEYYGGLCWMCRSPATTWDHVKPTSKGGHPTMGCNRRPACRPCNSRKGATWPYSMRRVATIDPELDVEETVTPVGILEIAERLGVRRQTLAQWNLRKKLPARRWTVSGQPAWDWTKDIAPWAKREGLL